MNSNSPPPFKQIDYTTVEHTGGETLSLSDWSFKLLHGMGVNPSALAHFYTPLMDFREILKSWGFYHRLALPINDLRWWRGLG